MSKKYKLVQATTNHNNDTFWTQIGHGLEKGNRISIQLNSLPLPNKSGEVWLQLYERTDDGIQKKNVDAQE